MSRFRLPSATRAVACISLLALPAGSAADPLSGVVRTVAREGTRAAATVVYAERLDAPAKPPPGRFALTQQDKAFTPALLAIPAGSTVDFPNRDPIFHNVFSLSAPSPFDLGLYRSGASRTRTFPAAATYRVFCNIHPQMTAFIVVVPAAHVTTASASGAWTLDVTPGRYRIVALSERAAPVSVEVDVRGATAAPALTLDESRFMATPHTNKFGQAYGKDGYTK